MGVLSTFSVVLAAAASVRAEYSATSKSNVVLYWGQNSAGQQSTQSRLSTYCAGKQILRLSSPIMLTVTKIQALTYVSRFDLEAARLLTLSQVLLLSFLLRFSGTGGQPVMNFANQGDKCTLFSGTETFSCPEIE